MFDPYDPVQLRRLVRTVRASYKALESHRKARRELVRDFIGAGYGDTAPGEKREMPINMLVLMVDIYLMHLAGAAPQVILPTARKDILPYVADLEAIVNKELEEMGFDSIVRRWVLEALFSIGVIKCGMVDGDYIEVIPGQPQPSQDYFADVVDFDNFVFDHEAESWERITYIGDRYLVDYDAIIENEGYDEEGKAALKVRNTYTEEDPERASVLSGADTDITEDDRFKKKAWVWDVALPEEGIVVTYADAGEGEPLAPLKVVEWEGTSNTPYHCLWFIDVPGNVMPLPPGQVVKSLNKSINALYRKLTEQAERQKTVGLFRHGEVADAERIQKASDGDLVPVGDPQNVKEVSFGGAAQENLAFGIHARDLFSQMAGNLDSMGGLGPQSETFRQDALISQTVSKKSARMARHVVDATTGVIRDFIYRIWEDPVNTYSATRQIPGTSVEVEAQLSPGERFGSFDDFGVKIEPYSMQYKSPQERASDIIQLMTNVVFPMMPYLQQQGVGVNVQKMFETLSKYMSLPELQHIFEFIGVPMPGSGSEQQPTQPGSTHRTYERISRPGASRQGNSQTMQAMLSGGNPQPSERAALGRPTGV